MSSTLWKDNWEESRQHYVDWWAGKGLVISMWEHLEQDGAPHAPAAHAHAPQPPPPRDLNQYWFDPAWRAANIHYRLSRSSFKADILPVANTHLGPGSLAAILGSPLEGGEDTIWIHPRLADNGPLAASALEASGPLAASGEIVFDEANPGWKLHLDLLRACRQMAGGRYFTGCPDLVEGLDTLASLFGVQPVLLEMVDRPAELERRLQAVNDIWFQVFERIYDEIQLDGEMTFCYFSLWAPGRMAKLQCDLAGMISPRNFRRFVQPYIRQQCQKLDYAMYHLDGVDAMRHLPALLEIAELNAIQWTPGVGQPQGGDPCWFELYKRIRGAGKSVMAAWVTVDQLAPLLDAVGPQGVHVLMDFKSEREIDAAVEIAGRYR
jgi:hypothetical protein